MKIKRLLQFFAIIAISLFSQVLAAQCNNDPPPVPYPCDADPICGFDQLANYCLEMENNGQGYNFPSGCDPSAYVLNNPNWFAFVAGENQVELVFRVTDCNEGNGIQMMVYEGDPVCTGSGPNRVTGLTPVNSTPPMTCIRRGEGGHSFLFDTEPCFTYYVVFDGWSNDLCDIYVDITQGGDLPSSPVPVDFTEFSLPEFTGPDTICTGAVDLELCALQESVCAAYYIFEFPDGTTYRTPSGERCAVLENQFTTPGLVEICIASANDCDTSAYTCKEYVVADPAPTYEVDSICHGESYTWNGMDLGTENLDAGDYHFMEDALTATPDCQRVEHLDLHIKEENEPRDVEGFVCLGDIFTFRNYPHDGTAVEDDEYIEMHPFPLCDSMFNITVNVIGFDVITLPPYCSNGEIFIEGQIVQSAGANIPFDDPRITTYIEWVETNSGDVVSNDLQLVLTEADLEMYPQGNYVLRISIIHPDLDMACEYESVPVEINRDELLPVLNDILGPLEVCVGSTHEYTLDFDQLNNIFGDFLEPDIFIWRQNRQGTIIETPVGNPIRVTFGPDNGDVRLCVAVETLICGYMAELCIDIDIIDLDIPDAGVDTVICGDEYTLQGSTPEPGNWTQVSGPGNASFINAADPVTSVSVDQSGIYEFVYTVSRASCVQSDTVEVTFSESPRLDGAVTYECVNSNTEYIATFQIVGGATPYTIVSGGGVIDASGLYTSENIENGGVRTIVIEDAFGCQSEPIQISHMCDCDTRPGTMDLTLIELCEDGEATGIHNGDESLEADDATHFILHDNSGPIEGTIFADNQTGTFGFQSGMVLGQRYYISLVAGNEDASRAGYVDFSDGCASAAPGQPVIWYAYPVADAGSDATVCGTEATLMGSTDAGSLSWSQFSGPGTSSIAQPTNGTTDVTVTEPGVYEYELVASNSPAMCNDTDYVSIEYVAAPTVSSIIYECDGTNENYRVLVIINSGGSLPIVEIDGKGTISDDTLISAWIPVGVGESFVVRNAAGCESELIEVIGDCDCETAVGTMEADLLTTCTPDGCVTATYDNTGEFLDADDVGNYVLHTGNGNSLGTIYEMNGTGEFCYDAALTPGVTYYISYMIGNDDGNGNASTTDPCLAVAAGQPVIFYQTPTSDAGVDDTSCGTTFNLNAQADVGVGTWTLNSSPQGSQTVDIDDASDAQTEVTVDLPGTYCFQWAEDNNGCTDDDEVCIEVLDYPILVVNSDTIWCDGTAENYFVRFDITGGDAASYMVTGDAGTLTGSRFLSDPIPAGQSYSFVITDANACGETRIEGDWDCDCLTRVGELDDTPLVACEDMTITVSYDGTSENLDDNDESEFIMLDAGGGEILRQDGAEFSFDPGTMTLGTEYTVRYVVGNDDGTGGVDLSDDCLEETVEVTLKWIGIPTAVIDNGANIITCEDPSILLNGSASTPVSGVTYTWTTSDGNIDPSEVNNDRITVSSRGTYTLTVSTIEGNCTAAVSVTITESGDIPNLEIDTPLLLTCARNSVVIDASRSDQGANYDIEWSTTNGQIDSDVNQYTITVSSVGQYTATLSDSDNGCVIEKSITVDEDKEEPTIIINDPLDLTCTRTSVVITSEGSSFGNEYSYEWSTSSGSISGSRTGTSVTATSTGIYILRITNTENGCFIEDSTTVVAFDDVLVDMTYTQTGLICEGGGLARLEFSPVGGVGPYTYELEPGGSNTSGIFTDLEAGDYTVSISDANGCQIDSTITIANPEDFEVELGSAIKIQEGDSAFIEVVYEGIELSQVIWEFEEEGLSYDCLNPDCTRIGLVPERSQLVKVTVISSNGCQRTDIVQIFVYKNRDVYVPSAFSPDGNNNNDVFFPYGGPTVEKFNYMFITDRWGERVYEVTDLAAEDSEKGWNGTFKGEQLDPEVFVYEIEVVYDDGETLILNGDVTLLK